LIVAYFSRNGLRIKNSLAQSPSLCGSSTKVTVSIEHPGAEYPDTQSPANAEFNLQLHRNINVIFSGSFNDVNMGNQNKMQIGYHYSAYFYH